MTTMDKQQKEELLAHMGKLIVQYVRDASIEVIDGEMGGRYKSKPAIEIARRLKTMSPEARQFIQDLVPYIVDNTVVCFLQLLDGEDPIGIAIRDADQKWITGLELTDGLIGEYLWSEGWVATYSQQRLFTGSQDKGEAE